MFFNKNGLKINLNFEHSLNEKEISEIEKTKVNKNLIRKESAIFFSKTSKSLEINTKKETIKFLRKSSINFPIISRIKLNREYIINRTSKLEILKQSKIKESSKNNFEIIKINDINIIIPKKIIETEIKENKIEKKDNKIDEEKKEKEKDEIENKIKEEKEEKKDKEIKEEKEEKGEKKEVKINKEKLFNNLININSSNIFIEGIKKTNIIEIQNKINDIELLGTIKTNVFKSIDISSKVNELTINKTILDKINKDETIHKKEIEIKPFNVENIEIKPNIQPRIYNIETNIISLLIPGIKKVEEDKILSIQSNIINFEIINKSQNKFENLSQIKIIKFDIVAKKIRMKKSPHLVLKKVDGFGNVNNKLFIKDINNIGNGLNNDEGDNNIKKFVNNKEIKMKMDKLKTKSLNHIQIKINNNNDDNNINFNDNENNKTNKIISPKKENKNSITINTINNEIIYNKQTIDFPVINADIIHIEEQYEKIKKDLNDLYPVFNKNKRYRENFFMQLSQGNHDKYNFYVDLYKIIKDEQEEKNNNNYENYLKMKKIVSNKNMGNQYKLKNKLRPLKKNKSSHYIFAKDKITPLYTES